jgi:hypothetical protein
MMRKNIVISLYDYTGEAVMPWADAGYECYCFDIQHDDTLAYLAGDGGIIFFEHADLHSRETIEAIIDRFEDQDVVFLSAFPVCTDMAVSGAAHFKRKAEADPQFQTKAAMYARWCADVGEALGCPYFVENPVSVLATLWRKPDHSFHPYQYGGYIPEDKAEHPKWPEYIPARDAYKKKTCLWTGGGFLMPIKSEVDCSAYYGNGYSKPMMKLGGKSMKTKNIRSATPRGFARAVFEANGAA